VPPLAHWPYAQLLIVIELSSFWVNVGSGAPPALIIEAGDEVPAISGYKDTLSGFNVQGKDSVVSRGGGERRF
jgi:hypothetical protein